MASVLGFVLRSKNRHKTARFYEVLGLHAHEHSHDGPVHYGISPTSKEFIVEIYAQSANFDHDTVMVIVDSVEQSLIAVAALEILPRTKLMQTDTLRYIYVTDPDGRDVMIVEEKSK
jgi:hypothetical protein